MLKSPDAIVQSPFVIKVSRLIESRMVLNSLYMEDIIIFVLLASMIIEIPWYLGLLGGELFDD